MKHWHVYICILLIVCCGPKKRTTTVKEEVALPKIVHSNAGYEDIFFGRIGSRDRSFKEDTLSFPPVPGLVHRSVYAKCPKDTCFAEYAVLALRCPPIQPLLNWLTDTVYTFINECPVGNGLSTYHDKQLDIKKKYLKSDKAICNYYMNQLQHAYDGWKCTGEGDPDSMNEQAGLLIVDYWNTGNLYTFYRIDWYDWMSCGNNTRESFWTVDAISGKLLGLEDLVLPEKIDTVTALMMPRLVNAKDEYIIQQNPYKPEEYTSILQRADGCALIPEGLVIYFYPYNLGSGADGQYEAVIPYEELDGIVSDYLVASASRRNDFVASHRLDELADMKKSAMLDSVSCARSNAEKRELIVAATASSNAKAEWYQNKIKSYLNKAALKAYNAEREAFKEWYSYQNVIASEVVVELWELYAGGSAGGNYECMHLYDIANANASEQEILYNALSHSVFAEPYEANVTMEQVYSAKDKLVAELKQTYSVINSDTDSRGISHTAEELEDFIDKDLTLFQKWIAARASFSSILGEKTYLLYSSQTGYWIDQLIYFSRINTGS